MDENVGREDARGAVGAGVARDRLWEASRHEFSARGFHGARVQSIARRAGCNVALMYRYWASKRSLYLEVLRAVRSQVGERIASALEQGPADVSRIVGCYLDVMMRDPVGARILIREIIDGGRVLAELARADPTLDDPARRAAGAISAAADEAHLRAELDPMLSILSVAGLAALVASSREAAATYFDEPVSPERWRQHIEGLLLHGLLPPPGGASRER